MSHSLAAPGGTYSLPGWRLLALGCEGDFRHFLFPCVFLWVTEGKGNLQCPLPGE